MHFFFGQPVFSVDVVASHIFFASMILGFLFSLELSISKVSIKSNKH